MNHEEWKALPVPERLRLAILKVADKFADSPRSEKIETSHDGYQFLATTSNYDGPGSPIGTSRESEAEAVADLKEQLAEAEESK